MCTWNILGIKHQFVNFNSQSLTDSDWVLLWSNFLLSHRDRLLQKVDYRNDGDRFWLNSKLFARKFLWFVLQTLQFPLSTNLFCSAKFWLKLWESSRVGIFVSLSFPEYFSSDSLHNLHLEWCLKNTFRSTGCSNLTTGSWTGVCKTFCSSNIL